MKKVQQALAATRIPAYVGVWRPTAAYAKPPAQYLVYSTMMNEDEHADDELLTYKLFVYMNLWSTNDVTAATATVRAAMRAAGFAMLDESDRGYNQPAYNTDADMFTTAWTWVARIPASEWDVPPAIPAPEEPTDPPAEGGDS